MHAYRAPTLMAATALALLYPATAMAQVADNVVVNIMRECAKIDDPTARLSCYDNNIRQAGANPRQSSSAPVPAAPQQSAAPAASSASAGFGSESVRAPDRFVPQPDEAREIEATVTRVTQREPGVYQIDLDDGAQWVFGESVSRTYRVPQDGAAIKIERASLGSFLMRFDGQGPVRVRRVR